MTWTRPDAGAIRKALVRYAPWLAAEPIEFLGEGWSCWTFRAGDHALRFPKRERDCAEFDKDRRLLPELARHVSLPIPVPDVYGEAGPNSAPFAGHKLLPGESLITAKVLLTATARAGRARVTPAPSFARDLGRFLREVHSFPVERAKECGVKVVDGTALRADRARFRDQVMRDVFPLVRPETRSYIGRRFDAYLCDDSNFDFEPGLVQGDMDRQNVLVDPATGELTGVIDFGGTNIGKPAVDFLLPLGDFGELGIAGQLPSFLEAYALPIDLDQARVEVDLIMRFLWPLYDVSFGLAIGNGDFVQAGVAASDALARQRA